MQGSTCASMNRSPRSFASRTKPSDAICCHIIRIMSVNFAGKDAELNHVQSSFGCLPLSYRRNELQSAAANVIVMHYVTQHKHHRSNNNVFRGATLMWNHTFWNCLIRITQVCDTIGPHYKHKHKYYSILKKSCTKTCQLTVVLPT